MTESDVAGYFHLLISEPIELPTNKHLIALNVDAESKQLGKINSAKCSIEPGGHEVSFQKVEDQWLGEARLEDLRNRVMNARIELNNGQVLECSLDLLNEEQRGVFHDPGKGENEMTSDKESESVKNFLFHLAKGGVKTLPVVGGILEEAIFGTMEAEQAGEESTKLATALSDLGRKVYGQSLALADVLSELQSQTDFHKDVMHVLDELIGYYRRGDKKASVPIQIQEAVEKLLSRYDVSVDTILEEPIERLNELITRLNKAISGFHVRKSDSENGKEEEITRVAIIRGLNGTHNDDLYQLIASFSDAEQYISSGSQKRRVIDLVRWAESPGKPGLEAIYIRASELGIEF